MSSTVAGATGRWVRRTGAPSPETRRERRRLRAEEAEEWDVFVCYAFEDREAVARPLATALRERGLRVWFDEMELRVGDRLRRKIDDGLAKCRYGIVVLSQGFFSKHFAKIELDGLTQREQDGRDLILPIWHDVDAGVVREFSPTLADRVALKWQDGIGVVLDGLFQVVSPRHYEANPKRGEDPQMPRPVTHGRETRRRSPRRTQGSLGRSVGGMGKIEHHGVQVYSFGTGDPTDRYCPHCWETRERYSKVSERSRDWERYLDENVFRGYELRCGHCGWAENTR